MFDFEKLEVYKKAKLYNQKVTALLNETKVDRVTHNQLRRASFSIMLNIAEGSGRFSKKDKQHFYVIARGSVFECVAIFDYLKDMGKVPENVYDQTYLELEEISKMLFALNKRLELNHFRVRVLSNSNFLQNSHPNSNSNSILV